ncbi:MAG: hypothetical protein FJ011_05465 [Chloroflexi bacterium]|nr:hypothetical protein [Chloroflexota bacterium]
MSKQCAPHELDEELLSAAEAFRDADLSEARWQVFEQERRLKRAVIELQEPAYGVLEELARQQNRSVSRMAEEVMSHLLAIFTPAALEPQARLRDQPVSYDVGKPVS